MTSLLTKTQALELRRVCPELSGALAHFFETECTDPKFHPHPFTRSEAERICAYGGADIYVVAVAQDAVLAYGMLRGWDEGYEIPSLGITVAERARGTGVARLLMQYLHANAKLRGAPSIRLKVYPDNSKAIALYLTLGYEFGDAIENGQMVGVYTFDDK